MTESVYHILMRTLSDSVETCPTFMTSLEVIRDVMNVPMEAVHAIARMNGIPTADDQERNISEKQLKPFTEAFERKTRNYFVNSIRNRALLTPQELQTFTEFCKTFKKGNVSLGKVSNWSHIGKTKLRQYFVDKIKEKTPSSSNHHAKHSLFTGSGDIETLAKRYLSYEIEPIGIHEISSILLEESGSEFTDTEYRRQPSLKLLEQFTSSWQYNAGICKKVRYESDVPDIVRQIILSARYYVYIDDDDDHPSDTVSVNGLNDLIINSTYRMVA